MPRSKGKRVCPCGSGDAYARCCRPVHQDTMRADPPSTLVRARFSAFALGDGEFLHGTVALTHPLSDRPAPEAIRELSAARRTLRYRSVEIRDERVDGDAAQVLFEARVFEKGKDRSFVELSDFVRERGAWAYAEGLLAPRGAPAAAARTIDAFLDAYGAGDPAVPGLG